MGTAIVRELVRASAADEKLALVAAVASAGSKSMGLDAGVVAGINTLGLPVIDELPPDLARAEVAIDFSRPDLSLRALNVCRAARVPIVIGTTGHGADFEARIAGASRDIAVLVAPNTSIGVAVAQELVRIARTTDPQVRIIAQTLPEDNASTRVLEKCGFKQVRDGIDDEVGKVWEWELTA